MHQIIFKIIITFFILLTITYSSKGIEKRKISVIPQPLNLQVGEGTFIITAKTKILLEPDTPELRAIAEFLAEKITTASGYAVTIGPYLSFDTPTNALIFTLTKGEDELGEEGYRLSVTRDLVRLRAHKPAGLFFGVQTIRQLLPPEIESPVKVSYDIQWVIPCVQIEDKPRFPWRGMLLDCGRHFMTKDFVKRYIELLAYHKMNRLHWHLTEDQGWRIEIKKYPKLTEIGAWRFYEDGSVYGGYYTQEDIKEVVEHARNRYVIIVPEIEMPGHSVAALASYPEYSCTGGPLKVSTQWGVHKDVYCAGNESTFKFIEDILTEVVALFPSEYIHIGGDECPKERWKGCPKCQKRIRTEGLRDEQELQSYFIKRVEKFLLTKNRRIIGWDEILEGGLAPQATVQSWRGMDGAITAAKSGHDAIVSPTSHAYFDYDINTTDLRKVYSFEPIPPGLTEEEAKHILGGECNLWTEQAPQEKIDSLVFPRLLAMSERLWSPANYRDYADFYQRVRHHYTRLSLLGVTYGAESRPVSILAQFNPSKKEITVTMEAGEAGLKIYYALNSDPSRVYKSPLKIKHTTVVKAGAFKDGLLYGSYTERAFKFHKALGKVVKLTHPYSEKYPASGEFGLTDGIRGTTNFRDGLWQGFEGDDLEALIDLGKVMPIKLISTAFLQDINVWIFMPRFVEYAISNDGTNFQVIALLEYESSPKLSEPIIKNFDKSFHNVEGRYIRVQAKNVGVCPDWHPGAGDKAWLFIDEIVVE